MDAWWNKYSPFVQFLKKSVLKECSRIQENAHRILGEEEKR